METETPLTDAKHHELAQLDFSDLYRYRLMMLHAREIESARDELLRSLQELSALTERAWDGMVIGKPIRNRALQVIGKCLQNVKGMASRPDGGGTEETEGKES